MTQVRCINPKSFSLTQSQVYDVISQSGRKVEIINDNGNQASYYLSLFEEVEEEEEAVELITVDTVMAGYNYDFVNRRSTFNIEGVDTEYPELTTVLETGGSGVTCGLKYIRGLNNFTEMLIEYIEENFDFTATDRIDLVKRILGKNIESIMQNAESVPAFILSTNQNTDVFTIIEEVVNTFTMLSAIEDFHNTNSGNPISIWIVRNQTQV